MLTDIFQRQGEVFGGFTYLQLMGVYQNTVLQARQVLTPSQLATLGTVMQQHQNHPPAQWQQQYFAWLSNLPTTTLNYYACLEYIWFVHRSRGNRLPLVFSDKENFFTLQRFVYFLFLPRVHDFTL